MSLLSRDDVTVIKATYHLIRSSGNRLRFMVCLAAPCENLDLSLEVNIELHVPHHFSAVTEVTVYFFQAHRAERVLTAIDC